MTVAEPVWLLPSREVSADRHADKLYRNHQFAYRYGQGPPGQVFMIPRAVLVQKFYEGAAILPWINVAEQILPADLEARGVDAWHLPLRGIRRREAHVAEFFQGLISWVEGGGERRSAHRVLYEAIRRLPGQAWFEETEGDADYLQLWCRGIIRGIIQDPPAAS